MMIKKDNMRFKDSFCTKNNLAGLLPRVSPRIHQGLTQYVPIAPEQRSSVGVMLLSGHTQDLFVMPFELEPLGLAEILPQLYQKRYSRFLHYSMAQGLVIHEFKASAWPVKSDPKPVAPGNTFLALARSAQAEVNQELKGEGRFKHEPHQALMEVHKHLQNDESLICLIEGIGEWEPICSDRPDILSAMETWADLTMKNNALVIFAAHQPSQHLCKFFKGRPCTVESQLRAPNIAEVKHWLMLKEMHNQQLSFEPGLSDELSLILSKKAQKANVGLKSLHRSLSGYLNESWLCSQGGRAFDPQRIDLKALQAWLEQDLIGQSQAKVAVMSAAENLKYFGHDRKQPLWRALFTGPPGVGKTEIARGLSTYLYGHQNILLINCTEYQQEHEVAKLLGAPPGYVGYGEPSVIEQFIHKQHAGVIIFDEFEKAHHKVHQALMGVLEEGFLQTPSGSVVELDRCVIIATSNAGHRDVQQALKHHPDLSVDEIRALYTAGVEKVFDGPLLRRFDHNQKVIFDFLSPAELEQVAELYLKRTCQRLAPQNLTVTWSADFLKSLVAKSDYTLGAGELKNIVEADFKSYLIKNYHAVDPKPSEVHMAVS